MAHLPCVASTPQAYHRMFAVRHSRQHPDQMGVGPPAGWPGPRGRGLPRASRCGGWGTWIRTKAARSRAGSSTAKLSPTGSVERGNTTPHPASATLPNRRGLRRNHVACGDSANQRLCGSGGLRDHARLSACAAKIALTVRASPSCHGGSRRPNTAANLPQSRRESAGRFALVGHSSVAIGAIVGTSTP